MKFKVGDRFARTGGDKVWSRQPDNDFKSGLIYTLSTEKADGSGGCECGDRQCLTFKVHFDGYDYRLDTWPGNCHTVAQCIIEHEVTEQDIEDALASIKSAMR